MKVRFERRKGMIWEAKIIPDSRAEMRQLQRIADVSPGLVSSTYGAKSKTNPFAFALNLQKWIQPRPAGRFLLVGDK